MQPTIFRPARAFFRRQFPTRALGDHTHPAEQEAVASMKFGLLDLVSGQKTMCVCMVRVSMRVHKSISLTIKAAEKAEQMDNFSSYICDCLQGDLHLKYEAQKRRIAYLVRTIKLAKELGSNHPKFKHECEMMLL